MRISITWLIALQAFTYVAKAQEQKSRTLIYARIEGNAGSVAGPHLGIAAIVRERHELGLAGVMYLRAIQNVPSDLECGCYHGIGYDGLSGLSATYAYLVYPGKSPDYWRIALRAGIVAGSNHRIHNFQRIPGAALYDANYSWEIETTFGYGVVLRPTVDLAINRNLGVSAGPYAVLTNEFIGGGVTFGVMLGRVSRYGLHQPVDAWKQRVRPAKGQR